MDAWRYGIYLLVFTFDISLVRRAHPFDINVNTQDKFHISARPCIILYLQCHNERDFCRSVQAKIAENCTSSCVIQFFEVNIFSRA